MNRPSRAMRESVATIRQKGRFFVPILFNLSFTDNVYLRVQPVRYDGGRLNGIFPAIFVKRFIIFRIS
jgi:hypothetical protein